jgi:gluconolactonase
MKAAVLCAGLLPLFVPFALQTRPASAQTPAPADPAAVSIRRMDPALDALLAPDAKPEKLAGGFRFTEGPLWHQGQLWFEDEAGQKTFAVNDEGKVTLLLTREPGQPQSADPEIYYGPNGITVDKDGSVLMCEQDGRRIVRVRGDAGSLKIDLLMDTFEGKRFNSPNDIVFGKDGALWFTDPPYGLKGMDRDPAKEIPFDGVYRWKDGKLTAPIRDLTLPNGLALSSDGKTLYVNNSGPEQKIMAYDVQKDGTATNARVLLAYTRGQGRGVPDGMKLDMRGNLWTTGPGGIRIVTPEGKVLGQIVLPETAANLAWGGSDGKTLYITASSSVYRLRTNVKGLLPLYGR